MLDQLFADLLRDGARFREVPFEQGFKHRAQALLGAVGFQHRHDPPQVFDGLFQERLEAPQGIDERAVDARVAPGFDPAAHHAPGRDGATGEHLGLAKNHPADDHRAPRPHPEALFHVALHIDVAGKLDVAGGDVDVASYVKGGDDVDEGLFHHGTARADGNDVGGVGLLFHAAPQPELRRARLSRRHRLALDVDAVLARLGVDPDRDDIARVDALDLAPVQEVDLERLLAHVGGRLRALLLPAVGLDPAVDGRSGRAALGYHGAALQGFLGHQLLDGRPVDAVHHPGFRQGFEHVFDTDRRRRELPGGTHGDGDVRREGGVIDCPGDPGPALDERDGGAVVLGDLDVDLFCGGFLNRLDRHFIVRLDGHRLLDDLALDAQHHM